MWIVTGRFSGSWSRIVLQRIVVIILVFCEHMKGVTGVWGYMGFVWDVL